MKESRTNQYGQTIPASNDELHFENGAWLEMENSLERPEIAGNGTGYSLVSLHVTVEDQLDCNLIDEGKQYQHLKFSGNITKKGHL